MKIKVRPTITLECPNNLEKYVDISKLKRFLGYDKKVGSFESQLIELAASRFLTQCLAMSISDTLNELNSGITVKDSTWLSVAKEIGNRLVEIEWDAKG